MILHYVHRGEVIHQHISGHVPVPGDQVTIGGYWYVVLKRYWHWDAGLVEIAVAPPVDVPYLERLGIGVRPGSDRRERATVLDSDGAPLAADFKTESLEGGE